MASVRQTTAHDFNRPTKTWHFVRLSNRSPWDAQAARMLDFDGERFRSKIEAADMCQRINAQARLLQQQWQQARPVNLDIAFERAIALKSGQFVTVQIKAEIAYRDVEELARTLTYQQNLHVQTQAAQPDETQPKWPTLLDRRNHSMYVLYTSKEE